MANSRDLKPATKRPRAKKTSPERYELRGLADHLPIGSVLQADAMSADVAVRVTCILACVRFISSSIACMPTEVMRRRPGMPKTHAHDLPCYDVLTWRPNSWQSDFEYKETRATTWPCTVGPTRGSSPATTGFARLSNRFTRAGCRACVGRTAA